ncbi:MAG: hypothetical protein KH828_03250 [Clostridiales bacterium]|nr:hypothetical protein [Clostridiales bacterium]
MTGAVGIARTLLYKGEMAEPLYSRREDGSVSDGTKDCQPSFFQEYKRKLENIYEHFYTEQGRKMAKKRQGAAETFYDSLLEEVSGAYEKGKNQLDGMLEE